MPLAGNCTEDLGGGVGSTEPVLTVTAPGRSAALRRRLRDRISPAVRRRLRQIFGQRPRPRLGHGGGGLFVRELTSGPSLVVVLLVILFGIPSAIALTPDQRTTIAGQEISVGGRTPSLSWSGPAQLVQIGNTELDVRPLRIVGPLRPRITLGPFQRNAAAEAAFNQTDGNPVQTAQNQLTAAFVRWYAWAAVILLMITIGLVALVGWLRMLVTMRRESHASGRGGSGRPPREPLTVQELWERSRTQVRAMAVVAIVAAMGSWATCGALAYHGVTNGLTKVRSLTDLVGAYYVPPAPVGPVVSGYLGAVIGDSRAARQGGELVPDATEEDIVCRRSIDSLAAEIGALAAVPVANLACSGASTLAGLRGPQIIGATEVPPQVGRLLQLSGLKFVVVTIGPNDLGWSDQLLYCYGVADCGDRLTEGEFNYRLAAFDRAYGDLLRDLNDLPGAPQVIIMTSYDVFSPDATCADTEGPPEAVGLSPADIELLADRNRQLNEVLIAGAEKYGFSVARPVLTPLCAPVSPALGPDIQGLNDSAPFHPTSVGMLRLASSVVQVLEANR
jgi:lysophospholipase L1-like esterase